MNKKLSYILPLGLTLLFVCAVLSYTILYLYIPPEYAPKSFSDRLVDSRNIGLFVGGLIGAYVFIWRAISHSNQSKSIENQAKNSQLEFKLKKEEFHRTMLGLTLENLNEGSASKRLSGFFSIEPLFNYYRRLVLTNDDKATYFRIRTYLIDYLRDRVSDFSYNELSLLINILEENNKEDANSHIFPRVLFDFIDFTKSNTDEIELNAVDVSSCTFHQCRAKGATLNYCSVLDLTLIKGGTINESDISNLVSGEPDEKEMNEAGETIKIISRNIESIYNSTISHVELAFNTHFFDTEIVSVEKELTSTIKSSEGWERTESHPNFVQCEFWRKCKFPKDIKPSQFEACIFRMAPESLPPLLMKEALNKENKDIVLRGDGYTHANKR